jgi:hypothetical protein
MVGISGADPDSGRRKDRRMGMRGSLLNPLECDDPDMVPQSQ